MSEPAVSMCFANSYSEKLKHFDKALSSEVANLKPFSPADFREMDSTAIVFFENIIELFKIFVPWKFIHCK